MAVGHGRVVLLLPRRPCERRRRWERNVRRLHFDIGHRGHGAGDLDLGLARLSSGEVSWSNSGRDEDAVAIDGGMIEGTIVQMRRDSRKEEMAIKRRRCGQSEGGNTTMCDTNGLDEQRGGRR